MSTHSEFVAYGRSHTSECEAIVDSEYDPISRTGAVLTNKNVISSDAIMRIEHTAYQLPDGRVCVKRDDTLSCAGSNLIVFGSFLEWNTWNRNRLNGVPDIEKTF